jgi:hypothetical protein
MKKFLDKIWRSLNDLFQTTFDFLIKNSIVAVRITDVLKNVVEHQLAEFVVTVIPGEIDDKILHILKKVVPEISHKLAVIHGLLQEGDSKSDSIDRIITYLQSLNPDARVSFWIMFSGELNLALSDGKINLAEAVALAQLSFNELKNRK